MRSGRDVVQSMALTLLKPGFEHRKPKDLTLEEPERKVRLLFYTALGVLGCDFTIAHKKAPLHGALGLFIDWSLAVPYFRTGNLHYHRR